MKEDIPLLMEHFNREIAKRKKKEPLKISKEIMNFLVNYKWPGNVRELENLVERLIILNDGDEIAVGDLPERFHDKKLAHKFAAKGHVMSSDGLDLNLVLDEIENNMIIQALELSKGVKSKAASLLGLNRTTLIEKLKKKDLQ
jgi:DNA-binding NtrC family response regulator